MKQDMNTYWPIYKNLEKEAVDLSYQIMFKDDQLQVYSVKIADLIFRCAAELESLYKDLYRIETGSEPRTVGDAVRYLDKNWKISKKEISIVAPNFYFTCFNQFRPFGYKNGDDNDFYSKYNAIKHDRVKNISKANLNILIRIMGALFVLNVYYKNQDFNIKRLADAEKFDSSLGSSIFSVQYSKGYGRLPNGSQEDTVEPHKLTNFIYLCIYPKEVYENIVKQSEETLQKQKDLLTTSSEYIDFIQAGQTFESRNIREIAWEVGAWCFLNKNRLQTDRKKALVDSKEYQTCKRMLNIKDEDVTDEIIDDICNRIGGCAYSQRFFEAEILYTKLLVNTNMNMVLNKGQTLYPSEWRNMT